MKDVRVGVTIFFCVQLLHFSMDFNQTSPNIYMLIYHYETYWMVLLRRPHGSGSSPSIWLIMLDLKNLQIPTINHIQLYSIIPHDVTYWMVLLWRPWGLLMGSDPSSYNFTYGLLSKKTYLSQPINHIYSYSSWFDGLNVATLMFLCVTLGSGSYPSISLMTLYHKKMTNGYLLFTNNPVHVIGKIVPPCNWL